MNVLSLFDGKYEVCSDGRVFSNARKNKSELKGKVCKKTGYKTFLFTVNNRRIYKLAHRLVAFAFIDNKDGKPEVNHIDGNKINNSVDNLEWVTSSENHAHAVNSGFYDKKLTKKVAEKIRAEIGTNRAIAKKYGIGKTQVGYIKNNKRWCK